MKTPESLRLIIMTGVHINFFRFSLVKSISCRFLELTWLFKHSETKCQLPDAILKNNQQ